MRDPIDWPALADPPELCGASAVLWVHGTGHARVSAAVHTAWFAAVSRGLDATVVVGLDWNPAASTRVAALALSDVSPAPPGHRQDDSRRGSPGSC